MPETLDEPVSLRDRVQSLRLPDRADGSGRGARGGWLPWTLCLLLAACTASLAARVYTSPPAPADAAAAAPAPASAPAQGAATTATGEAKPAAPAAGSVVLEAKGYIIAAHQIQVSPIEVSGLINELYIEEGKRFK